MDSSPHGRGPSKESSPEFSSSYRDHSPPVAPPHMMYYQPGMGYPGHNGQPQHYHHPPPGYAAYPNEYPNGYNNYQPPPYYGGGVNQTYHSGDGGRGFIRGFIMCSCIIFSGFFVATLVMALVLHPQLPVFKVSFLSVTNFTTNTSVTGDWNVSIIVENPNEKLRGYFSEFKVEMMHANNGLAVGHVHNFEMEKGEQKQLNMKASSSKSENALSFPQWELDGMTKEREAGSVVFGLRMSSMATFRSNSISTRNTLLVSVCDGLKVVFQTSTGNGTLDNGGKPIDCQLYV